MTITPRATTATSSQAQFFDYGSAANPLQKGLISTIPYRSFSASFFDEPGTALQPLDLSAKSLHCEGPATGPSLCGNFIRLDQGSLRTNADATSQLFFVSPRPWADRGLWTDLPLERRGYIRASRWR